MLRKRDGRSAAAMDKSCVRVAVYHLASPDSYWPDNAEMGLSFLYRQANPVTALSGQYESGVAK